LLVKYITKRFIGEYDPCFGKKMNSNYFRVNLLYIFDDFHFQEAIWAKHEVIDGVDFNVHIMDTYDKV
jgi:hypothetical protein